MGGPAMIEGGGLGACRRRRGPGRACMAPQWRDRPAGRRRGRRRGARRKPTSATSRVRCRLRATGGDSAVAARWRCRENRNALYDPRAIIDTVCATSGSVLELRRAFGVGVITALARLGGQPVADGREPTRATWAARSTRRPATSSRASCSWPTPSACRSVTFVDTPGFMVGPGVRGDGDGAPRRARCSSPRPRCACRWFSVVLRRGYGLGAMALTAGALPRAGGHRRLAQRRVRRRWGSKARCGWAFARSSRRRRAPSARRCSSAWWPRQCERGQALNMASHLEIDDVIDPAETRDWLLRVLASVRRPAAAAAARLRRHLVASLPRTQHKETPMFDTAIAGSLPKPALAGRDAEALAAVEGARAPNCRRPSSTPRCCGSRRRRTPAWTSSATASRAASTSCTASSSRSRASTSSTRSRWASAPTATRRWCRRWWRR